jgi:hypothetical protein
MYSIAPQFGRKHKEIYHFKTLDFKNIFLSKFDNSIEFASVLEPTNLLAESIGDSAILKHLRNY